MGNFQDIIGHANIIEFLQKAIKSDKISHAYVFNGEKGCGKRKIADALCLALQCENNELDGCMQCHSCKQVLSGNHPDVIYFQREKETTIGVDEIREQINNTVSIKPYNSKYKIYIIEDAHLMTDAAQNSLLKTIEEPPEYVIIILLTSNREKLLLTIQSRCVILNLRPVAEDKIKNYLMKAFEIPDYTADVCAAFSQGNVGRAVKLAKSDEFNELKNMALRLVKNIKTMEIHEMIEYVRGMQDKNMRISEYLDLLLVWYRDVLVFKTTTDANRLIFKEEIREITKQASEFSYDGIEQVIEAIKIGKSRIEAKVNLDLTLELLLSAMKENY